MKLYATVKMQPVSISSLKEKHEANFELSDFKALHDLANQLSEKEPVILLLNDTKVWLSYNNTLYFYYFKEGEVKP